MPLIATRGAASVQGFGEFAQTAPANYIEDVFSTYLYTGNGSTQTITNNIDISGKGAMLWIKSRSNAYDQSIFDTNRGTQSWLTSQGTGGAIGYDYITSFNSNGFGVTTNSGVEVNGLNATFASWTFRKQAKFFDVVTFTGIGAALQINHNLGSTPGCIIVKNISAAQAWYVYHRSLSAPANDYLVLNTQAASATISGLWGTVNSTQFGFLGNNGQNYVAYLFAHDAGGFGLTGSDNVITCGSYTGNGSATGPTINLGYEPQWVLIKQSTNAATRWTITDNMRGFPVTSAAQQQILQPNSSEAEVGVMYIQPTATGFKVVDVDADVNQSGATYIYIAIRRGPMKTPTVGTSVFTPVASRSSGTSQATPIFNAGFPVDWLLTGLRAGGGTYSIPRLTIGQVPTGSSNAEANVASTYNFGGMLGVLSNAGNLTNATVCGWNFRRAPGFFDVVCYAGTGVAGATTNHNLGVSPELVITRIRNFNGEDWVVTYRDGSSFNAGYLNSTVAFDGVGVGTSNDLSNFTSTTYVRNTGNRRVNGNTYNYVAYLFATLGGVSKVGSYTGTGTTLQVNCGFTNGSRFVLIKRTDSTGDWYVWDSARGIVAGNDPYLLINNADAEVTNTDYVDTFSSGFEISSTAPAGINANGGTYIFLAIA